MGITLKGSNGDDDCKKQSQLKGACVIVTDAGIKLVGGDASGNSGAARAVAVRKRKEQNKKRNKLFAELTEALLSCLDYMDDEGTPEAGLAECKNQMLMCVEEYVSEYEDLVNGFGMMSQRMKQRVRRLEQTIQRAESYKLLERYVYNLKLGAEGMSTNFSQRR